jgi:hypothetical protein
MPRLILEGAGTFDVEEGKRLVLAIEEDAGVDILHDVGPESQKISEFRFRAVIAEDGSQLLSLEH